MNPALPIRQTLYRVVMRPKFARRMQERLIVAADFEQLRGKVKTYTPAEWCAEKVAEVFA